jgi:CRP-like cAMP-binding protein
VIQGRKYDSLFVLAEGFALRYRIMPDGRRQVLNVLIPGDTVGYPACFVDTALYSVTAISKAIIYTIDFAEVEVLFRDRPRLALTLFWSMSREAALLGEHLADVGWRDAQQRLAHFLLEMATRLAAVNMGDGTAYELPLTQARIADVLGLSVPHVNRMLRRLREDGLIELAWRRVRILDRAALTALSDFNESYLTCNPAERIAAQWERGRTRRRNSQVATVVRLNTTPPADWPAS